MTLPVGRRHVQKKRYFSGAPTFHLTDLVTKYQPCTNKGELLGVHLGRDVLLKSRDLNSATLRRCIPGAEVLGAPCVVAMQHFMDITGPPDPAKVMEFLQKMDPKDQDKEP